jgi:hypothetical protein
MSAQNIRINLALYSKISHFTAIVGKKDQTRRAKQTKPL